MAKYIDREALIEWLKRIPLTDLSDGRGLCRVIMEDNFKKAIQKMPEGIVVDVEPVITGETSDGYHTFNELYHHRAVLFSVIVKLFPDHAWKSRKHHDGTMYDGMFIVGIETPDGQATYHYDIEPYWDMFQCKELEYAPEWDGHTPDEAIRRIGKLKLVQDVQAHWILRTDEYGETYIQCSNCKKCWHVSDYCKSNELYLDDLLHGDMIYCPSCGAKMDGGDNSATD